MFVSIHNCWVAQSCLTLCNPMDHSTPGSPVLQHLSGVCSNSCPFSWWMLPSNHLILCCPLLLLPSIFSSIKVFSSESSLRIRWPKIGASLSASVLPMSIQDWFPLGLTGLISLLSKGLSRVFYSTTVWKCFGLLSLLYGPTLASIHGYWKNHSFDYMDLCQQSDKNVCFLIHCVGLS